MLTEIMKFTLTLLGSLLFGRMFILTQWGSLYYAMLTVMVTVRQLCVQLPYCIHCYVRRKSAVIYFYHIIVLSAVMLHFHYYAVVFTLYLYCIFTRTFQYVHCNSVVCSFTSCHIHCNSALFIC